MPTKGAALYLSVLCWVHIFVPESLTLLRAGCEFLVENEPVHYLGMCAPSRDTHEKLLGQSNLKIPAHLEFMPALPKWQVSRGQQFSREDKRHWLTYGFPEPRKLQASL